MLQQFCEKPTFSSFRTIDSSIRTIVLHLSNIILRNNIPNNGIPEKVQFYTTLETKNDMYIESLLAAESAVQYLEMKNDRLTMYPLDDDEEALWVILKQDEQFMVISDGQRYYTDLHTPLTELPQLVERGVSRIVFTIPYKGNKLFYDYRRGLVWKKDPFLKEYLIQTKNDIRIKSLLAAESAVQYLQMKNDASLRLTMYPLDDEEEARWVIFKQDEQFTVISDGQSNISDLRTPLAELPQLAERGVSKIVFTIPYKGNKLFYDYRRGLVWKKDPFLKEYLTHSVTNP